MITIEFPEEREKRIGTAEAVRAIGMLIGPILGAVINLGTGDLMITFLIFACAIAASGIVCFFILPNRLNKFDTDVKRLTVRGTGFSMALVPEEF
jgi:MFS family permease